MARYNDGPWEFDVNRVVSSVDEELYEYFSALLLAAGWTITARGDGSSTHTDGSRNSVSDWAQAGAWEEWLDPSGAGGRSLIIQSAGGSSVRNCRMWLTQAGSTPSGGTGSTAPSAASQAQIVGTGGGYEFNFWSSSGTDGQSRSHMAAKSTPATGTDVYPFYIANYQQGGTNQINFVAVLGCETADAGTDTEPWVALDDSNDSGPSGWYMAGLAGEAYINGGLSWDIPTSQPDQSPYTLDYYLYPMQVYDTGGTAQSKGRALDIRYNSSQATGDTYNLATAGNAWIDFDGGYLYRWPTGVTPDFS